MSSQNKDNESTSKGKENRRGRSILKDVAKARKENRKFEQAFEIDESRMKYVLGKVGELARSFRKQLGKLVHDEEGNINDQPPPKYASIISLDEWTEFVSVRTSEKFQLREMGTDATYVPRHELWRAARLHTTGDVMDENVHKVWEECVSISQSVSQGERLPPDQDILMKALKAPEHPGRVRAVGYGVTKGEYFPRLPRKKETRVPKDEFEAMKKKIIHLRGMVEKNNQLYEALTAGNKGEDSKSSKDSCPPIIPEGVTPCDLYTDNPSYHLVGRGSVYNQLGETLHNRPLPVEHVRVGVEIILDGNAPLPVPNEDAGLIILDDALGAHVAWPIGLIDLKIKHSPQPKEHDKDTRNTKESVASGKEIAVQKPVNLFGSSDKVPYLTFLHSYVKDSLTRQWNVPMPKEIFNDEYTEVLSHSDIYEIINHEWLGSCTICVYVRLLYNLLLVPNMWMSRFCFINPTKIGPEYTHQIPYIGQIFIERNQPNTLFLAPYNTGDHWMLVVVNPTTEIVYYLDSLGVNIGQRLQMRKMFDNAIKIYRANKGTKCPIQDNGSDCGYYVLRYMKEILLCSEEGVIPHEYFHTYSFEKHSTEHIDEVKQEWCRYVLENIITNK
ncbi:Ulp1 protease family, C-terminal catalytic domain [Sesbania bispinosa]|nr:Ulp1 protease family, C-terminal catalytic domain [Sesbania bispinosa]